MKAQKQIANRRVLVTGLLLGVAMTATFQKMGASKAPSMGDGASAPRALNAVELSATNQSAEGAAASPSSRRKQTFAKELARGKSGYYVPGFTVASKSEDVSQQNIPAEEQRVFVTTDTACHCIARRTGMKRRDAILKLFRESVAPAVDRSGITAGAQPVDNDLFCILPGNVHAFVTC
jgi:hypothetical protein